MTNNLFNFDNLRMERSHLIQMFKLNIYEFGEKKIALVFVNFNFIYFQIHFMLCKFFITFAVINYCFRN